MYQARGSNETPVVILQGMDRNYRYTGSYDKVVLGPVPLDYVERLLDYVASLKYPPNFREGDLCPVVIMVEAWNASLEFYYNGDGTFQVRIIDNVSSADTFIASNAGLLEAKDMVRRFTASRSGVEELLGPAPAREYFINILVKECDFDDPTICSYKPRALGVSSNEIFGISTQRVVSIELRRGGFMRKPKLIMTYYDERGSYKRAEFKLPSNEEVVKAYEILNTILPGRVVMA